MIRSWLPSELLNARLSRRIVFWVFLSIVVIEVIILVPSVYRRERELLNYLKAISSAQTEGLLGNQNLTQMQDDHVLRYLAGLEKNDSVIGGLLYTADGRQVGTFGEPPGLSWEMIQKGRLDRYDRWLKRYDALWLMPPLEGRYLLVIRHDASWVQREFFLFIGRISGLVIIISIFVTGATMVVLERILIKPILHLRRDLLRAGEVIRNDCEVRSVMFESQAHIRQDELGDVIDAFEKMFGEIVEAITTRKQSEARFRTLVEQAADAFFVINRAGRIVDVNQQACESLGYSREGLLQLKVTDIQQSLTMADYVQVWERLEPHVPITLEGYHCCNDGNLFPVEVRIGILNRGNQELILALARDISERKKAEQAMARLAEIGELATMIVHEVRNPLTTVLMGLNSFRHMDLSERAQMRLELALEESERLQKLLNEILQYARPQTLNLQDFDLGKVAEALAYGLSSQPAAENREVRLTLSEQPLWVRGDVDKLKQVFINLITNACEAAHPGGTITWIINHGPNGTIKIDIHNEGEPIPPDILPKLTQPFFTTKSAGNGLGLAITKRIVEAHKGDLSISSSVAEGTTVELALPIGKPRLEHA